MFWRKDAIAEAEEHFRKGEESARKEEWALALYWYHQALKVQRENLGQDHPTAGRTLNSIGLAHMRAGDVKAAESALKEALYIRQEELRDVADDVAATLNNLSEVQKIMYE